MITDAAFRRTARDIVLHAETGEDFHLAVIHLHRHGNFQDSFRRAQDLAQTLIEFQKFRGHIELKLRDAKWIQILARRHARSNGLRSRLR